MKTISNNSSNQVKKIDYNSCDNQNIKGDFVDREVYTCVTQMVDYIIKKSYEDSEAPISFEDINFERFEYNSEIISFYDYTYSQKEEVIEELNDLLNRLNDSEIEITVEDGDFEHISASVYTVEQVEQIEKATNEIENLDGNSIEVYEWWCVSPRLAHYLEDKGEIVVDTWTNKIWGRTTTGQAILLDYVISQICEDLSLLK